MRLDISQRLLVALALLGVIHQTLSAQDSYTYTPRPSSYYSGYSVGSIPCEENVSPSGGRVITIPIECPTVRGVTPGISLTYNSQAGDGDAGWGWNVGGLSSISIAGASWHYDDSVSPADYTTASNQKYLLDGVRLVANPNSLPSSYQYETATGHVKLKKGANGGCTIFSARFPDGAKATFGNTYENGTQTAFPITYKCDVNENGIFYTYLKDGNTYHVNNIHYGGTTSAASPCEITFTYENRSSSEIVTHYGGGLTFTDGKRLTKIEVYRSGTKLREYQLVYSTLDGEKRLTSLRCLTGTGAELPPLHFDYVGTSGTLQVQTTSGGTLNPYFSGNSNSGSVRLRGKFLPWEYSDGIVLLQSLTFYGQSGNEYDYIYPSDKEILVAPAVRASGNTSTVSITTGSRLMGVLAADVDGDSTDELIVIRLTAKASSSSGSIQFTKYEFTSETSYTTSSSSVGLVSSLGKYNCGPSQWFAGDFLGNGKDQVLGILGDNNTNSNTANVVLFDMAPVSVIGNDTSLSTLINSSQYLSCTDFDGDGKLELLIHDGTSLKVYGYSYNKTNNTASLSLLHTITGISADTLTDAVPGDINGDGLLDYLKQPGMSWKSSFSCMMEVWAPAECPRCHWTYPIREYGDEVCYHCLHNVKTWMYNNNIPFTCRICGSALDSSFSCSTHGTAQQETHVDNIDHDGGEAWTYIFSTGTGYVTDTVNAGRIFDGWDATLIDLTGDGLSDLVFKNSSSLFLHVNNNGRFSATADCTGTIPIGTRLIPISLSNPYLSSSAISVNGSSISIITCNRDMGRARLLAGAEDSFGNIRRTQYGKISELTGVYSSSISVTFPESQTLLPLNVATSDTLYSTVGQAPGNHYTYRAPVINREGLGFRGFAETVTDVTPGSRRTTVRIYPTTGLPKQVVTPTDSTSWSWQYKGVGETENYVPSTVSTYNLLTGASTSSSKTWDNYGNCTSDLVTYAPTGVTKLTETTFSMNTTVTLYYTSFPSTTTVTTTRGNSTSIAKVENSYSSGKLSSSTQSLKLPGQSTFATASVKQYTYDTYGNVLTETAKLHGATTGLTTAYTYDSGANNVTSSTNPMGFTSTYSSYNAWGRPASVTDHEGRTTSYSFDPWGRKISETRPDGTSSSDSLIWGGAGMYKVFSRSSGEPDSETHSDALGRTVRKGVKRFDAQWQWTATQYDSLGRMSRQSLPFKGSSTSSPSYWETFSYDGYDRPLSHVSPSGNTTSWNYSGLSTTEIKDEVTTTVTRDATGSVVSVVDAGGTITYTLRADGRPSQVSTPGNSKTTFTYDRFGNRLSVSNNDVGTRRDSLVYFSNGSERLVHTSPNGTVTTDRDIYGRVTQISRSGGEPTTTYTYDSSDGLLASVSGSNGTLRTFTRDSYDRVTAVADAVATGKYLNTAYTYNTDGTIATVSYTSPSGSITTESYTYANGWNTKISLPGNITVWEITSENAFGEPTSAVTGGVTRTYGYDTWGYPTSRSMEVTVGGNVIQSVGYVYDTDNGNMLLRSDSDNNTSESFGYDSLNRLTSIGSSQITYSNWGNIESKGDVGTYVYPTKFVLPNPITAFRLELVDLAMGVMVNPDTQSVTYTSTDRPNTITQGNYSATFTYGNDDERIRMQLAKSSVDSLNRYYIGDKYERDELATKTIERLYLGGDCYSAPMVYVKDGSSSWTLYNIGRDALGSVTHVATSGGTLVAEYSYDAWGRLRNPATLSAYTWDSQPTLFTGRGYTGHEHLPEFGLINMNARLYDPLLGRFLSPDPYVADDTSTQAFNRYAYALNNPLRYTDESGEWLHIAIGSLIGGVVNMISTWDSADGFWEHVAAFGVGAVAGGAAAATGGLSLGTSFAISAATSALVSSTNDVIAQTGKNFEGFNSVDWGHVGNSAFVGGISGGAGTLGGVFATQTTYMWNSPMATSVVNSGASAFFGHVAGGTAGGMIFEGKSFGDSFAASFAGVHKSVLWCIGIGAAATYGSSYAEGINPWTGKPLGKGDYVVYVGISEDGDIKYVGITKRAPEKRWNEHLTSGTNRADLDYHVVGYGYSKMGARIIEQSLINTYGLKNLYNIRNSIDPKYWDKYHIKP